MLRLSVVVGGSNNIDTNQKSRLDNQPRNQLGTNTLRASPPLPPSGNGAGWLLQGAGQAAGSGPGGLASRPGQEAANATLVALWRGGH